MPTERVAGRQRTDGRLGFPAGCSATVDCALKPCRAAERGTDCLYCIRKGDFPWPKQLQSRFVRAGAALLYDGTPHIQLIEVYARWWLIVVYLFGERVDGRFPPILARGKASAIEAAHARARQLEPRAALNQTGFEPETWRLGSINIRVVTRW